MPTTDPLAACEKEFNEARAALSAVQRDIKANPDAESRGKLAAAQERFVKAGQELRRAQNPDRAHAVNEFKRYLAEKARISKQRRGAGVMGRG